MHERKLTAVLALATGLVLLGAASPVWADDCNINGIDDACDIDCGTPGGPCDVPGCGESDDCDTNGVPDECEVAHDCCETDHGAGCSDPVIETCVCDTLESCCTVDWSAACADAVTALACGTRYR